jgi:phosphate-selective porin
MKKQILLVAALLAASFASFAQEENADPLDLLQQKVSTIESTVNKLSNLKITGYMQPQWQFGQQAASLKVGSGNTSENGNTSAFNRFGIRRGRINFTYDDGGLASGVLEVNLGESANGTSTKAVGISTVSIKKAFLNVKDPWFGSCVLRAGLFDRPFGNEVAYSSSLIESPERSRVVQNLFPDEQDLGAMLILQPASTSALNFIKFQGGLFAGNSLNPETNNRKDFIGQIIASKPIGSTARWGLGASYYNGGVYQGTANVYTMSGSGFALDNTASNKSKYAKREYFGFDGQFSVETPIGMTQVRAEYMWGTQPGTSSSSSSPNIFTNPSGDTYIRNTSGWYAILVQDLGQSPFSLVLKYDNYDPNTKVSGDEIGATVGTGLAKTTNADLAYNTVGLGTLWRISPALRLQVYYEFVSNEKSANLASTDRTKDFSRDVLDNSLTVRLQFKF